LEKFFHFRVKRSKSIHFDHAFSKKGQEKTPVELVQQAFFVFIKINLTV